MRRIILLFLGAAISCLPESFSINDAGPRDGGSDDIGGRDAGADVGPDVGPDAFEPMDVGVDAAPSNRVNLECGTLWTDLDTDIPSSCVGRRVDVIGEATGPYALAVALLDQEVALAWNTNVQFDSGGIELRVLDPETAAVTRSASIEPEARLGEVAGTSISMVPDRAVLHLAYWVQRDEGSTVEYRQWSSFLSDAQTLAQVERSGDVSLGISQDNDATFGIYDHVTGRHFARTRLSSGELEPAVQLSEDLGQAPQESMGVAVVHHNGTSHLAYRRRFNVARAEPFYRRRADGGSWSSSASLDSPGGTRNSGLAMDIAASGDTIAVAYLDWSGGQAELRLATWNSTPDELVTQVVTSFGALEAPVYTTLDVEYDAFGLLHVLFIDDSSVRSLEYWRQRVGGTGWVRDRITTVPGESTLLARFVVGESRQPHIVFAARGDVHYATITP